MKEKVIYITDYDMKRLRKLIDSSKKAISDETANIHALEEELERAQIVPPEEVPEDVITMNSVVRIEDADTGERRVCAISFPGGDDEAPAHKVSILEPLGTCLLGYRAGDEIEWQFPGGTRRLRVIDVIYQPERLGNYTL